MSKTSLDQLILMSDDAINQRVAQARARIETRIDRCYDENRDLSDRELDLSTQDRDELGLCRDALEIRSARREEGDRIERETRERAQQISAAIETRTRAQSPLMVSEDNLRTLETARRDMRSCSVIETRAALTTSLLGTAVEYGAGGLRAPNTLWRLSGIPTSLPPEGYKAVVPKITLPVALSLVAEGTAHAEFDTVSPDAVTLGRAGAWSDLTSEAFISTSLAEISAAHARVIARNVDKATVAKIQGTAGSLTIDEALATVAAESACDVSSLWIVGDPVSVSKLIGTAVLVPTSAQDIGSYGSSYGGARVYATPTATAAELTVFDPFAFHAFATAMATGLIVDPTTGSQRLGQWMLFALGQSLAGGAVTVSTP
jgi:hypothetical protein